MDSHAPREYRDLQSLFREGTAKPGSTIIVSIDIEAYDGQPDPVRILELGLSMRHIGGDERATQNYHFRVTEHKQLVNKHCPSNPEGFAFGKTEEIPRARDLATWLSTHFWALQNSFETVVFAGWSTLSDLKFLWHGAGWAPPGGVLVVDVQPAVMLRHGLGLKPSLWTALTQLQGLRAPREQMHNAGNDAYWTLRMAFSAGGEESLARSPVAKAKALPLLLPRPQNRDWPGQSPRGQVSTPSRDGADGDDGDDDGHGGSGGSSASSTAVQPAHTTRVAPSEGIPQDFPLGLKPPCSHSWVLLHGESSELLWSCTDCDLVMWPLLNGMRVSAGRGRWSGAVVV